MAVIKLVCDRFESMYNNKFEEIDRSIDALDEVDSKFVAELLLDNGTGIQWGRIVGLLVFSSRLCIRAMHNERPSGLDDIIDWTICYLSSPRISKWIYDHGSWVCRRCH